MAVAPTTSGPVTSAYRPLPFRARRDMTAVRRVVGGRPTWFVKNPLKLDYFLMTEEDHFLWQLLDGRRSMVDLKRAFEARFPPTRRGRGGNSTAGPKPRGAASAAPCS
jgi:hypothetical protein